MDVGEIGENSLRKWCNHVDLIANTAEVDKDAWDFIVSFPMKFNDELQSLDKDDEHDRFLVQVKASKEKKGNRSIKLSNLKKLVQSPIPAFYLLIQVSERGEPISAHIFHVWEKIIAKVQERLRKVPKSKWDKLNKQNVDLPWSEAQEMSDLHGSEFLRIIKSNLHLNKNEYTIKKNELIKNVGYDKYGQSIRFTGEVPEEYQSDVDAFLVDFMLGEIEKIDLSNYEISDKRFGDEIIISKKEGGELKLKDIEPQGDYQLEFKTEDWRAYTSLQTQMIIPKGIGNSIDRKKLKILLRAPYFKFFIYPLDERVSLSVKLPDLNRKLSLSEIEDLASFILFLSEIKYGEQLKFKLIDGNESKFEGNFNLEFEMDSGVVKYFKTINYANFILRYFKINNNLSVKPEVLWKQFSELEFLKKLLSPNPLSITFNAVLNDRIEKYSSVISLFQTTVKISDIFIAIQVSLKGIPKFIEQLESGENKYELTTTDVSLEQHRILNSNECDLKSEHLEMDKITVKKYDTDYDVLVIHGVK